MRKFHHFTWIERLILETMLKDGKTRKEIAVRLGFHISNIYREIARGACTQRTYDYTFETRYSPDISHRKYRSNLKAKGTGLKIGNNTALSNHIEHMIINERYSPAAVLMDIKNKGLDFKTTICVATLYSYIDKEIFLHLTNKHLPVKPNKKRTYRKVKAARPPKGESIERRPGEVNERNTFGHWEMDTVKGKKSTKNTLLVLTERQALKELQCRMPDNTMESVIKTLDNLERKYGALFSKLFKTITVDNGPEFADCERMERSCLGSHKRTKIYYCHPYSSWERGSNENQNKLIRRWIPKHTPIENYTDEEIKRIETWINNYPRAKFGGRTSEQMLQSQLVGIT